MSVVGVIVALAGGALASGLQLRADLATLLPPSARSVRDLEVLRQRTRSFGTIFAVVEADDPQVRARAARELHQRLAGMDPALVAHVQHDDSAARLYAWHNRFLFADLADLRSVRNALAERVRAETLAANPLFVDLDDLDSDQADDQADGQVDRQADDVNALAEHTQALRARLDEAQAAADAPQAYVSTDERLQLVVIRSAFSSSDTRRGSELIAGVRTHMQAVRDSVGQEVQMGLAGDVVTVLAEQRSIMRGLWAAAAVTLILCAIALIWYFRAIAPVLASLWSLAVGTLVCFAIAELTIGHLNLVTAFLAAIVVGNGINPGLILLARYFEEVRAGRSGVDGLGDALAGAARGTLAASLAAGVAYGSLAVTDFDGFRHFGVLGAIGMVCCWVSAFTVLPAALCILRRRGRISARATPALGVILARLLARRRALVWLLWIAIVGSSAFCTWRFIRADPVQRDWSNLRPDGPDTRAATRWYDRVVASFDDSFQRAIAGPFAVGVDRRSDTPTAVASLRTLVSKRTGPDERDAVDSRPDSRPGPELLAYVRSLDDLLPTEQAARLAVLADIRRLLHGHWVADLGPRDRALVERIRPPDGLRPLADGDVPDELAWMFTEGDGTRGRLILAGRGQHFESWNIDHWREIAAGVRALDLPPGSVLGGKAFVFSDMLEAMERDGPRAALWALVGALAVVWLLVGLGRHGLVTIACGATGLLVMVALVGLSGIEINVIDFIALPITIGIGIDYAVNIAARARAEPQSDAAQLLRTTGGAVLLCSFTTIVGYGSLLLSDSGGIRSFGHAALLGELACVASALVLAPTLLGRR